MEYFPAYLLHEDPPQRPREFYEKLIKEMKKVLDAGLVHTDLSEFNVLNYNEEPILIDFSQAVDLRYPNVQRFLRRDVRNVVRYFSARGLALDEDQEFEKLWTRKA